jgi:hypothetical protein
MKLPEAIHLKTASVYNRLLIVSEKIVAIFLDVN